jgi:hypothetical protein
MVMQGPDTAISGKRVRGCTTSVHYPISSPLRHGLRLGLKGQVDSDKIS